MKRQHRQKLQDLVLAAALALGGLFLPAQAHAGFWDRFTTPGQTTNMPVTTVLVSTNTPTQLAAQDYTRSQLYITNVSTFGSVNLWIATSAATCVANGASAFQLQAATNTTIGPWGVNANTFKDDSETTYAGSWYAIAVGTAGAGVPEYVGKAQLLTKKGP